MSIAAAVGAAPNTVLAISVLGQGDSQEVLLLGDDFMPWMVLAFGAALVVGNVLALIRPPRGDDAAGEAKPSGGRPPLVRTAVMIVVGAVASAWGLASLLT